MCFKNIKQRIWLAFSIFSFVTALLFPAWAETGIDSGASWKHAGWSGGGYYFCAAFHPTKMGVMYVGGDVGGMYKTVDNGKNWRYINKGLAAYGIFSIAIDKKNPDTLYVGTEEGICKSTDGGENWKFLRRTGKGLLEITFSKTVRGFKGTDLSVKAIAVDPSNSNVVYAGSIQGKIFKSEDGGRLWKILYRLAKKGVISYICVADKDPNLVLAATTATGILKSEDAGKTWIELSTPRGASSVNVAPTDENIIYASFGTKGIYKSTDRGESWTAINKGFADNCRFREVIINPKNADIVYCIGRVGWEGYFYKSTNGGKTWKGSRTVKRDFKANPTIPDDYGGISKGTRPLSSPKNIALNPRNPNELLIAGNWMITFSSDGGKTWEERDRGADIAVITDIEFQGKKTYVTAMDMALMMSEDNGRSWRALYPRKYNSTTSGHTWRVLVWRKRGAEKIIFTHSPWRSKLPNQLFVSEDGKSFEMVKKGLPNYRSTTNCMWDRSYPRAFAADPKNPNIIYLGMDGDARDGKSGGGIFKSVDGGYSWKHLENQPGSRRMFYGLVVDPTNSNRIFWGSCGTGGGLYRSDDAGKSWKRVFKDETWIFNVAVSKTGVVYSPGKNLWKSMDHGDTWKKITDFGDCQIVGLEIDPRDEKTIWISRVTWGRRSKGFVYKTTDGGVTWVDITGNLPYRKPTVLRFNPVTNELWAGGVGLFRLKTFSLHPPDGKEKVRK